MPWTKENIEKHKKAAKLLCKVKDEAFKYIGENKKSISEYQVQKFIFQRFKHYNLKTDRDSIIVSFGENTQYVHYYPSQYSKKLSLNSPIMLDIWARLNEKNAPFADITWMGYYGSNVSKEFSDIFVTVIKARDSAILEIKKNLQKKIVPSGIEIHRLAMEYINSTKFKNKFTHSLGHSIGFTSPHGSEGRYRRRQKPLMKNMGYTIEPGIYLENKYGARSELDFYIDTNNKMIITSEIQKELIKI